LDGDAARHGWIEQQRQRDRQSQRQAIWKAASVRDISEPLVDQTENLRQVEASAKVLQSSTDAFDHLIDILA
jgi:hypothetical protein